MKGSYLGPSFDDNQVETTLKSLGANYEVVDYESLIDQTSYYLSKDYSFLGFFADDGTTLYFLLQDISFSELVHHSFNWDAARDLHLIWQKFFILISSGDKISSIHFYQVIFYIINVILFCYILKQLQFNNSYLDEFNNKSINKQKIKRRIKNISNIIKKIKNYG